MAQKATPESFEVELNRLVAKFERSFAEVTRPEYPEARLRQDFLDPFFRALGWDLENDAGLILSQREVEIESRTDIAGKAKRADYLFRTDGRDRFVCEAKKPREDISAARHPFQAKRYAYNKNLPLAVLSDFEALKIYIVGGKPHIDRPDEGEWKSYHFKQYPIVASELWQLLARENVAAGSIDALLDTLPRRAPTGRGRARQLYLIRPDRTRALDTDFLAFLDDARRDLASSLLKQNDRADILSDGRLNEATQHILNRLLFLRICEDRDIDTGTRLDSIVQTWQRAYEREEGKRHHQGELRIREEPPEPPGGGGGGRSALPRESLWFAIVRHFRALDRRPPSHVPFFNGQLFKPHFSEDLLVGDEWLADFICGLSADESPYLFNVIPVEILGSVYERFLGKVVRPQGRGVTVEEKPEVRKAGGVYYTPRYIVDYIVEQTVGRIFDDLAARPHTTQPGPAPLTVAERRGKAPKGAPAFRTLQEKSRAIRILDPACGSGSFLIRAFERVCEHWQAWFTAHPEDRKKALCWVDPVTSDVHLTVDLKRRILRDNIYGVDLDAQAVEVTQLSLYLKMLEGETRDTLKRERELLPEQDIALLPPLDQNIKRGNSLIASDFSLVPEDLVRVHAFDWEVQFRDIMRAGGFDAVIGNPPYRMLQPHNTDAETLEYLRSHYVAAEFKIELFHLFLERGVSLLSKNGRHGHIVPTTVLNNVYAESLRRWLSQRCSIETISVAKGKVFEDADVHTSVLVFRSEPDADTRLANQILTTADLDETFAASPTAFQGIQQDRYSALPGSIWNILLTEQNVELISRLAGEFPPLGKITTINRGLITGDRKKYFSFTKDSKAHVAIIAGGDVHRYFTCTSSEYVLFERPDSAGGCWDVDVHLAAHKLVIRQIGTEPTASIVTDPIAVTGNLFTIRAATLPDEKYLLGIINSKLIAYFWKVMFTDFKSSFPQVTIFSLSQLPVRALDRTVRTEKARHDKLVSLVDKMLALTPKLRAETNASKRAVLENAIRATDQQIDHLVYELYDLTPEEKDLVENAPA